MPVLHYNPVPNRPIDPSRTSAHRVVEVRQETTTVRSFVLENLCNFKFLPGQFVLCSTDSGENCPVTLTSAPEDEQLMVTIARQGAFGARVYDRVQVGDSLHLSAPGGGLALASEPGSAICFIARDTGVMAAHSYFRHFYHSGEEVSMVLLHEISDPHQVLFDCGFRDVHLPGFRRHLFLDGNPRQCFWPGLVSRVTAEVIASHVEDLENTCFLIAGAEADVEFFSHELSLLPVPSRNLLVESWG